MLVSSFKRALIYGRVLNACAECVEEKPSQTSYTLSRSSRNLQIRYTSAGDRWKLGCGRGNSKSNSLSLSVGSVSKSARAGSGSLGSTGRFSIVSSNGLPQTCLCGRGTPCFQSSVWHVLQAEMIHLSDQELCSCYGVRTGNNKIRFGQSFDTSCTQSI